MGIESDKVVYEYLSRVGDIAQQQQLSSATRMRLVSELRNEIDRRRSKAVVDSPAAVRRIIDRLGSPDDVVAAAADGNGSEAQPPTPSVPVQPVRPVPVRRDDEAEPPKPKPKPKPKGPGLRRRVPGPRPSEPGDGAEVPDWWRQDPHPHPDPHPDPLAGGDEVPGFVGGVEIPAMLRAPKRAEEKEPEAEEPAVVEAEEPAGRRGRRLLPALRGGGGWSNPLLLLAAGALVAGAVLGNWFALIVGWAIAYASRRLTERETKLAVMWLPGLSVTAGLVWLWGRGERRWGAPIAEGHMNDAIAGTWPWVVRGAAVASALFLIWRSRKAR